MAQTRIFDYHDPRTTDLLNTRVERTLPVCVLFGMSVSKGTSDFDIDIGTGDWLCDGTVIHESAALSDELTLDDPSASDRIDVIYGTFAYEADTDPTPASYAILKGTPGATPVEPSCASDQVKIAAIYIPSDASDLDDCQIQQAYVLKDKLTEILGLKVEGNFWIRAAGDPFLTSGHPTIALIRETKILDGDLWLDLTGLDLYIYDADNNQWVTSSISSHGSTHICGAGDPLDVKDLCDTLSYLHKGTKTVHEALGISHASLSGVTANQHHAQDHSARHHESGADELDVDELADSESYLHKHEGPLSPNPHGDDNHLNDYAPDPHGHQNHSGVMSRGQFGFETLVAADCLEGAGVWKGYLPKLQIPYTTLEITELYIKVATAPSSNLTFTVKKNAVTIGTVTLVGGTVTATTDITDVEISDGDYIVLDAPADNKGAKGLCFYCTLVRTATGGVE